MPAVVLKVPKTEPLQLSSDDADGLTYWKELIYAGDFKKWNKKTGEIELQFTVDTERLDNWNKTIAAMRKNGIEIPIPNRHTEEPEARRASLLESKRQKNKDGLESLFGKVRFVDKEAAKLAASTDVSIYADSELVDGKGNYYFNPIRHVALTDYPVIPGLEKFEAIALSLVQDTKKMALDPRALAKKLGIADDIADADLEAAIDDAVDKLVAAVNKGDKKPADPPAPPKDEVKASHSPLMLSLLSENRQAKIDALLLSGHIIPAQAKELTAAFCDSGKLVLSLSAAGEANDGFDAAIKLAKANTPRKAGGEKSPAQVVELSNADLMTDKNPLLANAQARGKSK
jgi:hypothetical protein